MPEPDAPECICATPTPDPCCPSHGDPDWRAVTTIGDREGRL